MRTRYFGAAFSVAWMLCFVWAPASAQDETAQQFALGGFTFESGTTIDNAHVTYVT